MSKATVRSASQPSRSGSLRGSGRLVRTLGLAAVLAGAPGPRLPGAAADEPVVIHVRGRTQLHLSEGERTPSSDGLYQLTVLIQLDDGQGSGAAEPGDGAATAAGSPGGADTDPGRSFARQSVRLRLSSADGELGRQTVTTGHDGRAAASLGELPAGSYTVVADYAGDELRDPARADLAVDLGRQPVLLGLSVPGQAARTGELALRLSLLSDGKAFPATVALRVDSLRRPVRMVGGFAQETLALRGLPALRKGQLLGVIASYPGDRQHGSALQRRDVLLTSQARVTLELAAPGSGARPLASAEIAQGNALTALGTVQDEDGPLPGEPVDLEVSEQPGGERSGEPAGSPEPGDEPAGGSARPGRLVASGITDSNGRFRIVIPRLPLRPGPAVVAAQVTPRHRYILPARAAELPITVLPPEPVSAVYYLLPLVASALGGLLWVLGRWLLPRARRLLDALRARLRPRAAPEPATAANASAPALSAPELAVGEPGVSLSQGRRLAGLTLRRTVDTTLEGQVVDASSGRPVGGAVLSVQPTAALPPSGSEPGRVRTVAANEEGRFAISQLAAGRYLVEVSAPGYLPQRFPAASPHRGELRGVSVRLEPIRVRLLGEWRRVAQNLLGQESRLRTATPRELLAQFGRLRGAVLPYGAAARDLSRLTELVEQACYSPRICTPQMLDEAAQLASAVLSSGAALSAPLGTQLPAAGPPVPLS